MAAPYRWYSIGRPRDSDRIVILGWSRDQAAALRRAGTVAVYWASSRQMAARKARHDRGFDIEWRKF